MNKVLHKNIRKLENKKEVLVKKKSDLSLEIKAVDEELKPLYKLKKEEEDIILLQKSFADKVGKTLKMERETIEYIPLDDSGNSM